MSYTRPSYDSFNLSLEVYTRPSFDALDFGLSDRRLVETISPTFQQTGVSTSPAFSWSFDWTQLPAVDVADRRFQIQVVAISVFGETPNWANAISRQVSGTTYTFESPLSNGQAYAWRVTPTKRNQVTDSTVTSVVIIGSTTSIEVNNTRQFQASVGGTNVSQSVTWTASGGTIDTNGLFTAGSETGSASVTATSVQDPSVSSTVNFNIVAATVVGTDLQALKDLYNAMDGSHLPTLASDTELTTVISSSSNYPLNPSIGDEVILSYRLRRWDGSAWVDMGEVSNKRYMINGNFYYLSPTAWVNAGAPLKNLIQGAKAWDISATELPNGTDWYGVTVEVIGGQKRVVHLDLQGGSHTRPADGSVPSNPGNNLVGQLNNSLGNLTKCRYFNVKSNFITGDIPASLSQWEQPERILISGNVREPNRNEYNHVGKQNTAGNSITGQIPNPTNWGAALEVFECSHNTRSDHLFSGTGLTGSLPAGFGNCTNLKLLLLNDNSLSNTLPAELSSCTDMFLLSLANNQFTGTLPAEWGTMTKLMHMRLYRNQLEGSIPLSWANMKLGGGESSFMVSSNKLSGAFPAHILEKGVWYFIIGSNDFTGELPQTIDFTNITVSTALVFNMNGAGFHGRVPNWVTQIKAIQFEMAWNYFGMDANGNHLPSAEAELPEGFHDTHIISDTGLSGTSDTFEYSYEGTIDFNAHLPKKVRIVITGGTGKGQYRYVESQNGTTFQIDRKWDKNPNWDLVTPEEEYIIPDQTSKFTIYASSAMYDRLRLFRLQGQNPYTGVAGGFTGSLPQANLGPAVLIAEMGDNLFTGTLPTEWGKIHSDRNTKIDVNDNNLSGLIPTEVADISFLGSASFNIMDISGNNFSESDISAFRTALLSNHPTVEFIEDGQTP